MPTIAVISYPGLLTPAFVACSNNAYCMQATNAGVEPGYAITIAELFGFSSLTLLAL